MCIMTKEEVKFYKNIENCSHKLYKKEICSMSTYSYLSIGWAVIWFGFAGYIYKYQNLFKPAVSDFIALIQSLAIYPIILSFIYLLIILFLNMFIFKKKKDLSYLDFLSFYVQELNLAASQKMTILLLASAKEYGIDLYSVKNQNST